MYEERKNSFSLKDVVLQLMLVILFIFVMIWLFPTKSYLEDNYVSDGSLQEQLKALYGQIYTTNITNMSDAATKYFTNERLPKKVGESTKITLSEMLNKKMLIEFKDSNNNSCDVNNSYVEVTKMDNEYQMKVQLTCTDYSDYIIVYLGCYDYCDSCQKQTTTNNKKDDSVKPVSKKYMYEYRLVTQNKYSDWSGWSSWSTNKVTNDNLTNVELKTESVIVDYKYKKVITGYENKEVTKYRYEDKEVQVGTKEVKVGTKTIEKDATKKSTSYSDWVKAGIVTSKYALSNTSTVKYEYISDSTTIDCDDVCKNVTIYKYTKYTRSAIGGKYECSTGWTLSGTKCTKVVDVYKEVPIYETQSVKVAYTDYEKTPIYETKKVAVYDDVKYYRYRTRKQVSVASTDYKWSYSNKDTDLLNKGYKLTGNSKEV